MVDPSHFGSLSDEVSQDSPAIPGLGLRELVVFVTTAQTSLSDKYIHPANFSTHSSLPWDLEEACIHP